MTKARGGHGSSDDDKGYRLDMDRQQGDVLPTADYDQLAEC
jgi:hypothetical protein